MEREAAPGRTTTHQNIFEQGTANGIPGVAAVSGAIFSLVCSPSSAATHGWHAISTYGFLAVGAALIVAFAARHASAAYPHTASSSKSLMTPPRGPASET